MALKQRILICDDHQHITRLVQVALAPDGYEVVTAANGDAGWKLCLRCAPQLVITDHDMPGMTGLELCQRIREDAAGPQPGIILLTARSFELEAEEGADALARLGINAVVMKPFSPRELRRTVAALFAEPRCAEAN